MPQLEIKVKAVWHTSPPPPQIPPPPPTAAPNTPLPPSASAPHSRLVFHQRTEHKGVTDGWGHVGAARTLPNVPECCAANSCMCLLGRDTELAALAFKDCWHWGRIRPTLHTSGASLAPGKINSMCHHYLKHGLKLELGEFPSERSFI